MRCSNLKPRASEEAALPTPRVCLPVTIRIMELLNENNFVVIGFMSDTRNGAIVKAFTKEVSASSCFFVPLGVFSDV